MIQVVINGIIIKYNKFGIFRYKMWLIMIVINQLKMEIREDKKLIIDRLVNKKCGVLCKL